jgi:glyoxylase-like metal-dependent hydrolase (beta-lactamase superfamily II)
MIDKHTATHSRPYMIGDIKLTAVSDGVFQTTIDTAINVDRAVSQKMSGLTLDDPVYLSVNAFLLERGPMRALIDAGSGNTMGSALGKLPENLRNLGIDPQTITHILLTHIHPDHSNGLVDGDDKPYFPNAELIVHEKEAAFFVDRDPSQGETERTRKNIARAVTTIGPYKKSMRRVQDGEALPGISAINAPGHTPGHTSWVVQSGKDCVMMFGDIIHMHFLQLKNPDIAFVFDVDPQQAILSRKRILDMAAADNIRVAGAHLDFPGLNSVSRNGDSYELHPDL